MIVLEAQGLCFSYDHHIVLDNWSQNLQSQRFCHLKGLNGSGKSTLMKLLAGILMPQVGNVVVDVQKPFLHAFAYVGHQLGLHPGLTIQQNLSFSLLAEHKGIDDLLKSANLWRERDTAVRFLSVGQRQKVALIRIFLQKAMIWLLDEPFANLDEWSEAWLWEHLDEHLSQNGSVILTAHQRTFTREGVVLWQMS